MNHRHTRARVHLFDIGMKVAQSIYVYLVAYPHLLQSERLFTFVSYQSPLK